MGWSNLDDLAHVNATNTCCCTAITSPSPASVQSCAIRARPCGPGDCSDSLPDCFGGAAITLSTGLDRPRNSSICRVACDFGYSHSPAATYKGFSLQRIHSLPLIRFSTGSVMAAWIESQRGICRSTGKTVSEAAV